MLSFFVFIARILLALPLVSVVVHAQTNILTPAAYPLAVRSPYLQAWESSMKGTHPNVDWPLFWEGKNVCDPHDIRCAFI